MYIKLHVLSLFRILLLDLFQIAFLIRAFKIGIFKMSIQVPFICVTEVIF